MHMPQLRKQALSQFIRTECKRQLRLNLSPNIGEYQAERDIEGMPPVQPPRPGLGHLAQAGEKWQEEKVADLSETFGVERVIGDRYTTQSGRKYFRKIDLINFLSQAEQYTFLIEAEFEISPYFEKNLGIEDYRKAYNLNYARLRPDIIEVLPPAEFERYISSDGNVLWLPQEDCRLQLRVIDIKLTAEPSPSYFAEVTYYSMALAGWLIEHNLENQFVVVPNAAIWPGSHKSSNLVRVCREMEKQAIFPTYLELWKAFQDDLEPVPFEVFAGRIRHFFHIEIPEVLSSSWEKLSWHVDNKCKGCDYLGYPWKNRDGELTNHELQCIPMATQLNHLSRVAFVSRGASNALRDEGISNVLSLSQLPPQDSAFDSHYSLCATRYVIHGRASSLQTQEAEIPEQSGTSAVMPKWADLRIYITVNFDLGSAITFAMGLEAFWIAPYNSDSRNQRENTSWGPIKYIVDEKNILVESRELLRFLSKVNEILRWASERDENTTVQFYIWDSVQYKHFSRIIGRHLHEILGDLSISHLAWLFPPEELLPNSSMETRRSPITIVKDVIRSLLAAPIPHYYTLFSVARVYHHSSLAEKLAKFNVHPLFDDPLSDQIPSERAHEIWARTEAWNETVQSLQETVQKQLMALKTITRRLEEDLKDELQQNAPRIQIEPPERTSGISFDGQLWYGFSRLNSALGELEVHRIRAMPPHEREAKFKSAKLTRRLIGEAEVRVLSHFNIVGIPGRRVYEMSKKSKEVKLREGDFAFALAPENDAGFLDRSLWTITRGTPLEPTEFYVGNYLMESVTRVNIVAIDRDIGVIVLDSSPSSSHISSNILDDLELYGLADFSKEVILDPVWVDTFTKKLHNTLHAIGNPSNARDNAIVRRAVGLTRSRKSRTTHNSPVGDVLWSARELAKTQVNRNLQSTRPLLEKYGILLNESQWNAWELALGHRLQLIWGPPGTGKSRTLRAIALGAIVDAYENGRSIRILICAPTYNAMDNVLREVYLQILKIVPEESINMYRVRSRSKRVDDTILNKIDLELSGTCSRKINSLIQSLEKKEGITVVGTTPQQTYNLLTYGCDYNRQHLFAKKEYFDLIILDEASQMDVGNAILPIASLASDGSLVVAGDPKQLPPIHNAKPPVGLECMVGSIYDFFKVIHEIEPAILKDNYRSNDTIVKFAHEAGYDRSLKSYSPNLHTNYIQKPTYVAPINWPQFLYWTPNWSLILEQNYPVTCFIYPEGKSGQWNLFEAEAVTALVSLLYGRMGKQLLNERNALTGEFINPSSDPYDMREFWEKGIGIVTPHRAQQALIISKLQQAFSYETKSNSLIRDAVDTVERFQGQQRDIIIASYALGDQDAINDEDEFLMSLNRFNVMSSRARAKLIVLVSQEIVNHLSGDLDILRESRLLKVFAESYCNNSRIMDLGYIDLNGNPVIVEGVFKYRE